MARSGAASRATSGLDHRELEETLEGNLALEYHPLSRTIRLFVSSDLEDSKVERNILRKNVFPKLRKFCQSLGLQLHVVDMYRDILATPDTMYKLEGEGVLQLALEEIKQCQQMSAGPTFITFLAQKYGHKPLRTQIPVDELKLLYAAMEDPTAKQLVQRWYTLDTNAVPVEYVLQTPDTENDMQRWQSIHNSLSKAIRRAAKVALGKDVSKVQNYIMSATEEEVTVGIFNLQGDPNQCCYWSKRTFTDLLEQRLSDPALPAFTDLIPGKRGLEFDLESTRTLNHLKEARMPAKYVGLDASNIFEFPLKWQRNKGLDPELNSEYLAEMSEILTAALEASISESAKFIREHAGSSVYQEVLCHGTYCKEKAKDFLDCKDLIGKIQSYINSPSDKPLVVFGPSGSGKTSIMAAAASQLKENNLMKKMAIVLRFLGTTPHSSNIMHTLSSICEQISFIYGEDDSALPGDSKGLAGHFKMLLHKATAEKPLYLFLDAVDQLSAEDGALGMSWLPLILPPHVKVILSTSSEVHYRCYPVLQSLLSKHQENFVEVLPLSGTECKELLNHCMASKKRKLTSTQESLVLHSLQQCPSPLYLQFLMKETVTWHSYTEVNPETFLPPPTLDGMINDLFSRTEVAFGPILVSHMLGYITAVKYGLSESELMDVLACDMEVVDEMNQRRGSEDHKLLAVPPLLWSKIFHHLSSFLEFKMGIGNILVLRWSHKLLKEVAYNRYLHSRTEAYSQFSRLAEYFSGHLACTPQEEDTVPSIADQPLMLNEDEPLYNVRKLVELPFCLAACGRNNELRELLVDFNWLKACVNTTSCADVVSDFLPVLPVVPLGRHDGCSSDHELRLLRDALRFSVDVLNSRCDPTQLCVQFVGRLLPSVLSGLEERPILKNLIIKALEDTQPQITPLQPFSHIPGGPLLVSMEGHRDLVSSIAASITYDREGQPSFHMVSSSWDKTLKSWHLESTGVLKTFDGHTDKVLSVAMSADGLYAMSGSADSTVRHWYVPTGHCLHTMRGHSAAINAMAITSDGCKAISASSDRTIKVWNSDHESSYCGELIFTVRSHSSPVLSLALLDDLYLASGAKNGVILTSNITSGEILMTAKGHLGGVTALAATRLQSCAYLVSGSEDGSVKTWELISGKSIHTLLPENKERGAINDIAAGSNGKIVTASSSKVASVWDLESGSHLYDLSGHRDSVCSVTILNESNLAITGSADFSVRIWDLQNPPVFNHTQLHSEVVTSVVISPCGSYGISASKDATVKVYELESLKVLRNLSAHEGTVNHVFALRDSRRFVTASSNKTVQLWDGESGEVLQNFEGHEAPVSCIAITRDSELLMSGAEDGKVIFWSLKTGKKLKTFTNHSSGIIAVDFAQHTADFYMLSISRDGLVCVRDFHSAKIVLSTHVNPPPLLCLSVSPNASCIAVGLANGTGQVLQLPDGRFQAALIGHKKALRSIKVLPDSETCLTGSDDQTLRIWNIKTGECLTTFYTDAPVLACDISRNMTILYGTAKGTVSTALYQTSPNPILKKLQGIQSPSASTITTSQSTITTSKTQPEHDEVDAAEMMDKSSTSMPISDGLKQPSQSNLAASELVVNTEEQKTDNGSGVHITATTAATKDTCNAPPFESADAEAMKPPNETLVSEKYSGPNPSGSNEDKMCEQVQQKFHFSGEGKCDIPTKTDSKDELKTPVEQSSACNII